MKNIKYIIGIFIVSALLFTSCQDDDGEVGEITSPTNIEIAVAYMDQGAESQAPGLGSGEVVFTASADNASAYQLIIQGQTKVQSIGSVAHIFTTLGTKTYTVTAIAYVQAVLRLLNLFKLKCKLYTSRQRIC